MQPEQHTVTHTINRYRSFRYELILEGVAVGAIAGAVVVAFRYLIGYADTLLNTILDYGKANTWFIPVWFLILAAAAFAVAGLLKWDSLISGSGIPQVEGEIIGEIDECWWRVLIAKLGGGILSLGCGLSLGRRATDRARRGLRPRRFSSAHRAGPGRGQRGRRIGARGLRGALRAGSCRPPGSGVTARNFCFGAFSFSVYLAHDH